MTEISSLKTHFLVLKKRQPQSRVAHVQYHSLNAPDLSRKYKKVAFFRGISFISYGRIGIANLTMKHPLTRGGQSHRKRMKKNVYNSE